MRTNTFMDNIKQFFSLETELENQENVYNDIKKGIVFKGTNLWILIFAIIIASVGLNMNSTAVIIGAMLISPLMGPINGMGYSIATFNFPLFRKALKNFSFAIIASLVASTLYFTLSPVSTAHAELLARTSPTIYDVLIALFGGLAGIVAISSKQKGNVLPGVAIATALMPPLCTAGYGIATQQWLFFFGAFYLFTINTIFIAIASVLISQLLNFPIRTIVDPAQKKKINRIISSIIVIVLIPSIYFGYQLVQEENFKQKANRFVQQISPFDGHYLLKHDIEPKENRVSLIFSGPTLSDQQKKNILANAKRFGLSEKAISVNQGIALKNKNEQPNNTNQLQEHIQTLTQTLHYKDSLLQTIQLTKTEEESLLRELKILYPAIQSFMYTVHVQDQTENNTLSFEPVFILSSKPALKAREELQIKAWLEVRLQTAPVKLIFN